MTFPCYIGVTAEHRRGSRRVLAFFLLRIQDRLYQSPATYYSATGRFGIAPGMEDLADPDFLRPVTAECLWRHSGQPNTIAHSLNRFEDPRAAHVLKCEGRHSDLAGEGHGAPRMLAHILVEQGRASEARVVWEAYLELVPQSVNARLALRAAPSSPHER